MPDQPDTNPGADKILAQETAATTLTGETQAIVDENRGLSKLLTMDVPDLLDDLLEDSIAAEMEERIKTAQEVAVFQTADEFALRYMKERIIPSLELDTRQQEAAMMVVERKNFGKVKPMERAAFMRLSHIQEEISRKLIMYMIDNDSESAEKGRGINNLEIIEFDLGSQIASAIDEWYMEWESRGHDIKDPGERVTKGFVSKWHIVKGNEADGFKEVPYSEIFPQEHGKISKLLDDMVVLLEDLDAEEEGADSNNLQSKLAFYQTWKTAHDTPNADNLPKLWQDVEAAYARQKGRIIAIYPIEEGYGENKTGMIPEYSLRFLLSEATSGNPIADSIKRKHAAMLKKLPAILQGKAKSDVEGVTPPPLAYFAVRSGLELVFKIAGQSLPNDAKVREEVGILTTVNPDTMKERIEEAIPLFKVIFGDKYDSALRQINLDEVVANVAVHEMGHPIGDQLVFEPSAHRSALEEWKASATEWALMALDENITEEQLRGAFMSEVLQAMRYTQRREEDSQKPYYGASQYFMKTAQDAGLIDADGTGCILELNKAHFRLFAETVKDQWIDLQALYEEARVAKEKGDTEGLATAQAKLDQWGADALTETQFILKVQQICDTLKA